MIKKIFYTIILCLLFIGLCGCKDTTPRIFLSTKPIARETFEPMSEFKKNDTINFVLIVPKGFKSETIRLMLIKKNGLSPLFGDTLALGKDFNVEHDNYLTGAFTVYSGGRYELRFYDYYASVKKKTVFTSKSYTPKPDPVAFVQFGVYD